ISKYIFMIDEKHPNEIYDDNDFKQLDSELDYIIEFKGKWNDILEERSTEIVFHKGDKKKFYDIEWKCNLTRFKKEYLRDYHRFKYNYKYSYMVISDKFENKVVLYLKNIGLGVSVIKNYLINGSELFFRKGEKCYRNGKVILLDDGSIKDFEIYLIGKYTIFGDNGTDIWCNFRGYPLLV